MFNTQTQEVEQKKLRKDYIDYSGHRFHQRADPDAYVLALALMAEGSRGAAIDLAAGSGYTSLRLQEMGFDVVAYDINTEQFVPSNIKIKKLDLNGDLPDADASLQAVMALEVIEHMDSPRRFLKEIGRVLKPGGVLVVSTPNITSMLSRWRFLVRGELELFFDQESRVRDPFCDEASGHVSPILPWLLKTFLTEAGLRLESIQYTRRLGLRSRYTGRCLVARAIKV